MGSTLFSAVVIACAFIGVCYAGPQSRLNGFTINDYDYYGNTDEVISGGRACRDQGGELAKIWNVNIYNRLRNHASVLGSYWIDGIDRPDLLRFDVTRTCQNNLMEFWAFNGNAIPAAHLDLPQVSCLSLVKGATARNSRIEAANCNEERFVICQSPITGCQQVDLQTTTMMANGDRKR